MATRAELKSYFETNDIPTQSQFAELIDSVRLLSDPAGSLGAIAAKTFVSNPLTESASPTASTAEQMGVVSVDLAQSFTAPQKLQARTNIGALSAEPIPPNTLVGNPTGAAGPPVNVTGAEVRVISQVDSLPIVKNLRLQLQSATSGGTWGPRDGSIIAFFGNSAFLIGGWAGDPYDTDWVGGAVTNQIYRSNDFGVTWTLARGHDLTPASDQLPPVHTPAWAMHTVGGVEYCYVFGGDPFNPFSDTWRSSNGTTWEKVNAATAPYDGVYLAAGGSINGNLYHAGGHTTLLAGTARNTVYKSTNNGVSWTQIANAPWASRFCLDRMPAWKGKLWVVSGGKYDNDVLNRIYYNDVWSFDPVTETWTEVLANGTAPWDGRLYANVFVFDGWLYISRGVNASGNLSDTWRTLDGVNWIEVPELDLIASHADGVGIHSTGVLLASGNGDLAGTPTNANSPSYFARTASQTAQESITEVAHNVAQSYNQPLNGILREGYTENSNPRRLIPGDNAKLLQVNAPNFHEGQPDKNVIGAYVANGITYVYVGGGIDLTKECAQSFQVFLGADNTLTGEPFLTVNLTGTSLKENTLGVGVAAPPSEGIDLQAHSFFFGSNESNPNNRTVNAAKVAKILASNFNGVGFSQCFGAYNYSGTNAIYFGGGLTFDQAANVIEFWTASTQGGTLGVIRMRINSSGVWVSDGGTMKLIEIGAADSGGTGFKMLRIAN